MYMIYHFKKRLQLYIYTFNALFLGSVNNKPTSWIPFAAW